MGTKEKEDDEEFHELIEENGVALRLLERRINQILEECRIIRVDPILFYLILSVSMDRTRENVPFSPAQLEWVERMTLAAQRHREKISAVLASSNEMKDINAAFEDVMRALGEGLRKKKDE